MKALRSLALMAVLLSIAGLAGAQVLNQDVGVPLGTAWNQGTPIIVIGEAGTEDQVTPIGEFGIVYPTALPGDLILTNENNPAGGNAPSNWLADIRFFNPLDPNGILGLPATETEAFFPGDLGPGGFASLQLLPDFNYVPAAFDPTFVGNPVIGTEQLFGPVAGVNTGQTAIIVFSAYPGAPAAPTPEPGGLALLCGTGVVGVGFLIRGAVASFMRANNDYPLIP